MSASRKSVTVACSVTREEKLFLEEQAAREGVTVSTFVYRRLMNKPDAVKKTGRPPRIARTQDDGFFPEEQVRRPLSA